MKRAWKPVPGDGPENPSPPVTSSGTRPRPSTLVDLGPCRDFDEVYRRTHGFVHSLIRRQVPADAVDDVFQDVYVAVARQIDDDGVPEPLMRYVVSTVLGKARNYRKVQRRRPIAGEIDEDTAPSSLPDPEQALLAVERHDAVTEAAHAVLASVSDADRRLLVLSHTEGLSAREIGELLDRRPGSIGVELQRARDKARRIAARFHDLILGSRRKKP
jgi:RNA polymerase sigma-70 factor (ECF subfamily)